MFGAIQMWRIMPFVRKKIAAQYPDVAGERGGRLEPVCREPLAVESSKRAANPLLGGIVIIGTNQANHFSVIRGLEETGEGRLENRLLP
jgi:hypothetical protein